MGLERRYARIGCELVEIPWPAEVVAAHERRTREILEFLNDVFHEKFEWKPQEY